MKSRRKVNAIIPKDSTDNYINKKPFKYNFVDIPWDYRTRSSKFLIIALIVFIILVILALICLNLYFFYKKFIFGSEIHTNYELNCNRVKFDKYPFIVSIFSKKSMRLLCIGIMVTKRVVLATNVCIESEPIFIRLGTSVQCRSGVTPSIIQFVRHPGVTGEHLVLLQIHENFSKCASDVDVEELVNSTSPLFIIGRPTQDGKTFSRQAGLVVPTSKCHSITSKKNWTAIICMKSDAMCPVRIGDILLQHNKVVGIASDSIACHEGTNIYPFAKFTNLKALASQYKNYSVLL